MTSLRLFAVLNVGFKYARYENFRKVPYNTSQAAHEIALGTKYRASE